MKENTRRIVINKPIDEVFEFSIKPENSSKWWDCIAEERAGEWPPKIGTIYETRGDLNSDDWNRYHAVQLRKVNKKIKNIQCYNENKS